MTDSFRPVRRNFRPLLLLVLVLLAGCRSGRVAFQFHLPEPEPGNTLPLSSQPLADTPAAASLREKAVSWQRPTTSVVRPTGTNSRQQRAILKRKDLIPNTTAVYRHHRKARHTFAQHPADSLHGLGVLLFLIGLAVLVLVTLIVWATAGGTAAVITGILGTVPLLLLAGALELL